MLLLSYNHHILLSVLLITGGHEDLSSVEVLSPTGVRLPCSVPPLPEPRFGHTQDGEVACGGGEDILIGAGYDAATLTNCVSLTASGWITSHKLNYKRQGHVSWSVNIPGYYYTVFLMLMGGNDGKQGIYSSSWTTEDLSYNYSNAWPSFDLEYATQ